MADESRTVQLIRQARLEPQASTAPFRDRYQVDYRHANYQTNRRRGHIHAWQADGRYLGVFTTHQKAVAAGADVTRVEYDYWFIWTPDHEWRTSKEKRIRP